MYLCVCGRWLAVCSQQKVIKKHLHFRPLQPGNLEVRTTFLWRCLIRSVDTSSDGEQELCVMFLHNSQMKGYRASTSTQHLLAGQVPPLKLEWACVSVCACVWRGVPGFLGCLGFQEKSLKILMNCHQYDKSANSSIHASIISPHMKGCEVYEHSIKPIDRRMQKDSEHGCGCCCDWFMFAKPEALDLTRWWVCGRARFLFKLVFDNQIRAIVQFDKKLS